MYDKSTPLTNLLLERYEQHKAYRLSGMKADLIIMDDIVDCARPLDWYKPMNCLADCKPVECLPCTAPKAKAGWGTKKKDESPMNYASATVIAQDTTEKDQRRFLGHELSEAYSNAKTALLRKFGLTDDEAPVTLAETMKRIQDGLFVIPEKYKDTKTYGAISYLRWRDPKAVEDKDGFEAAKAELKKARNHAERVIAILSPAEGLKAVLDFETSVAK